MAPWITVLSRHTIFTKRVIYHKFTSVRYSAKQGATHRPTSHLSHCARLWPQEEHRWRSSCADFADHCLLWLLLSRLSAVPPQNSLLTSLAFAPDSEAMSATRISVMASSWSFIYFFPAIPRDPQSSALFRLLCMTYHSFRNVISVDMNIFYSDRKTDLKLQCNCVWISSYSRVPKMLLLDWRLYVAFYTPQLLQITPALQEACLWALL